MGDEGGFGVSMIVPENWLLILFCTQLFVLIVLVYLLHIMRMRILETILKARAQGAATPEANKYFVQIERLLEF